MSRKIGIAAAVICAAGIAAGLMIGLYADTMEDREAMGQAVETAEPGREEAGLAGTGAVSGNEGAAAGPGGEAESASENDLRNDGAEAAEGGGEVSGNDTAGTGTADGTPGTVSGDGICQNQEERTAVKGIYVTGAMAGTSNVDSLIELVERTELNTLVIDIKNDDGRVVCEMDSPMVEQTGSVKTLVKDMPALVQKCKERGIYLIGRIVAFKDPYLAEQRTDLALHDREGKLFRDNSGLAWVNPYKREVWEYLLEIAGEAVEMGFDEIQFDYIRFATERGMKNVDFGPEAAGKDKEAVITEFVEYAADRIHEMGAFVSADVYGIIIDSRLDASIVGQNYYEMSKYLDYISPMVYPSHYGPGNLGLDVPDAHPYETIYRSMSASRRVLSGTGQEAGTVSGNGTGGDMAAGGSVSGNEAPESTVSGNGVPGSTVSGSAVPDNAVSDRTTSANTLREPALPDPRLLEPAEEIRAQVRPWLQDFTATWVDGHIRYGPEEIRAQIQAVYDAGYSEWILWNAANCYTEGGLEPEEEPETEERPEEMPETEEGMEIEKRPETQGEG